MDELLNLKPYFKTPYEALKLQISEGDNQYNRPSNLSSNKAGIYVSNKNEPNNMGDNLQIYTQTNGSKRDLSISVTPYTEESENESKNNNSKNISGSITTPFSQTDLNDESKYQNNKTIFLLDKMLREQKIINFISNIDPLIELSTKLHIYQEHKNNHIRCFRGVLYFHSGSWSNRFSMESTLKRDWKRLLGKQMLYQVVEQLIPNLSNCAELLMHPSRELDIKLKELIKVPATLKGNDLLTLFKDIMPTDRLQATKERLQALDYHAQFSIVHTSDYLRRLEYLNDKFITLKWAIEKQKQSCFNLGSKYYTEILAALQTEITNEVNKVQPINQIMTNSLPFVPLNNRGYSTEESRAITKLVHNDRIAIEGTIESSKFHSEYQ